MTRHDPTKLPRFNNGLLVFCDADLPKDPPGPVVVTYLPGCNAETAAEAKDRTLSREEARVESMKRGQRNRMKNYEGSGR